MNWATKYEELIARDKAAFFPSRTHPAHYIFIEVGSGTRLGYATVQLEDIHLQRGLKRVVGTDIVVAISESRRVVPPQLWPKPTDREAILALPGFEKWSRPSVKPATKRPGLGDEE